MRRTRIPLIALALASLATLAGCSDGSRGGQAGTVHIRGVVYAFFGIDDHLPGAVIRIDEYPELSAPVAADGSYDIEVPDDVLVTPYVVPPPGYRAIYLQTFHTSGEDLEAVHFQVVPEAIYTAFAALLKVPVDENGTIRQCAIVSTFSILAARQATEFDPGFKDVYPHGLPGSTATIDPRPDGVRGAIYFSAKIVPDPKEIASSVDGGVLWLDVPPGWYWMVPEHPTERLAPFLAHCVNGRLVNASPPWGFYQLAPGEEPDPAVLASAPRD